MLGSEFCVPASAQIGVRMKSAGRSARGRNYLSRCTLWFIAVSAGALCQGKGDYWVSWIYFGWCFVIGIN